MEQNRNDVLSAAFSKARNMIQKDSANNIGNSKGNTNSIYDMPIDIPSYTMNENVNYDEPSYTQPMTNFSMPQNTIKNTNLPVEIFESMTKNVIDTKPLSNGLPELGGSVLDNLNIQPKQNKKIVSEQITQPQQIVSNSNIDYSLIKTIVEDCVKKYTGALKKSILQESKENLKENVATLQAMKIGNKFSFVDDEGNLYEAKLTFVKNLNKNKGGK